MEDSRYLTVWLRAMIPLICLAVLISSPGQQMVEDVLLVSSIDVAWQLWRQSRLHSEVGDPRFSVTRDSIYALLFFVANFHSTEVPALAISPVVVAEILVVFGWRYFAWGISLEATFLVARMSAVRITTHHFVHPAWMMLVVVASIASAIFGLALSRLNLVRLSISQQRAMMKDSLTEMLQTTFAEGGLGDETAYDSIRQMIEEICRSADPDKGRQLGLRLAHLIALRQNCANLLTARERELLLYLASGLTYRQIAGKLIVSEGTVRAHAASIMRKADVHSRQEAVEWAKEQRLLS